MTRKFTGLLTLVFVVPLSLAARNRNLLPFAECEEDHLGGWCDPA